LGIAGGAAQPSASDFDSCAIAPVANHRPNKEEQENTKAESANEARINLPLRAFVFRVFVFLF
jgi:hypothetical protein